MTAVIRVQAFLAVTTMGSNCIENLNYVEKDKVQSTTDSVILWEASCGYYATKVQSLVDLASGLDDAVQTQPEADQTVTGDFKLIFDGLSFASSIAPNELSIKSKANGGLDITADTNGLTTVKAKGVPVQSYDENGVQMLENLKMPLSYASTDDNDVTVKSELTAVAGDVAELDGIAAKTDQENTFQEKQTLENGADVTGLINNTDTGVKHNLAQFLVDGNTGTLTGAPNGWTGVRNDVGSYTISHNLDDNQVYPVGIARVASAGFVVNYFPVDENSFNMIVRRADNNTLNDVPFTTIVAF